MTPTDTHTHADIVISQVCVSLLNMGGRILNEVKRSENWNSRYIKSRRRDWASWCKGWHSCFMFKLVQISVWRNDM